MAAEKFLDVNFLEPPEPLERILSALDTLSPGCYLRVWIHREPFPLYEILEREGFSHAIRTGRRCAYELFIWRRGDESAQKEVDAAMQDGPVIRRS